MDPAVGGVGRGPCRRIEKALAPAAVRSLTGSCPPERSRSCGWEVLVLDASGSGCDDVEVGVEFVDDAGESLQDGRLAVELDGSGLNELAGCAGLQQDADQRGLGSGDGELGVRRGTLARVEHPRLIHIDQVWS